MLSLNVMLASLRGGVVLEEAIKLHKKLMVKLLTTYVFSYIES